MLKGRIQRDKGGPLLVFGLSARNIALLQAGRPIQFDLSKLGIEGEIMIFAGDTEESMTKDLEQFGFLPAAATSTENPQ